MTHEKHKVLATLLMASLLVCASCSTGDSIKPDERQARVVMNVLSIFYGEYLESHRGKPPESSDEFREYLESRPEELKRNNVTSVDQLLTSPRDGLPLVMVCGKRVAPPGSPGTPWAAYEQSGVNDKRLAVQVRGGVHEFSTNEIDRLFEQP